MRNKVERLQTVGEEIANSVTHGLGLLLAIGGTVILIINASMKGDTTNVVGVSIFGATMIILYLTSTLYHALPRSRAKNLFRLLDHGAIFLLIAGTYTPFTLGVLSGKLGWTLFALEWALALTGVFLKTFSGLKYSKLEKILYLAMGWLVIIATKPLYEGIGIVGILLILAGGLCYTLGMPFYIAKQRKYTHLVWHFFVLAGTICHFFAVMWFST